MWIKAPILDEAFDWPHSAALMDCTVFHDSGGMKFCSELRQGQRLIIELVGKQLWVRIEDIEESPHVG